MALLTRKRLILSKTESTYGTDSTPTGTDALLVRELEITPIEADVVSRDLIRPYLGSSDQLLANARVSITFQVEMAGSGAGATAPRFSSLLKACGMAETTTAAPITGTAQAGDGGVGVVVQKKLPSLSKTGVIAAPSSTVPSIRANLCGVQLTVSFGG